MRLPSGGRRLRERERVSPSPPRHPAKGEGSPLSLSPTINRTILAVNLCVHYPSLVLLSGITGVASTPASKRIVNVRPAEERPECVYIYFESGFIRAPGLKAVSAMPETRGISAGLL